MWPVLQMSLLKMAVFAKRFLGRRGVFQLKYCEWTLGKIRIGALFLCPGSKVCIHGLTEGNKRTLVRVRTKCF